MKALKALWYEIRRHWPMLACIVGALMIFGDGAQLAVTLYQLSMTALILTVAHFMRRALFPYADLSDLASRAKETAVGSAIVFAAVVVLICAVLVATAGGEELPDRAKPYLPTLAKTFDDHWPEAPLRCIVAGQVEQESGWRAHATLKTPRELGRGLAQLTVAYRSDGTERFNAYREAVAAHKALAGWDWQADPYHVGYALAYMVLRDRAEWTAMNRLMVDEIESWRAALVCYNAGRGRVLKRRAYAMANSLPENRWKGGLADAHGAAEEAILYGKPQWVAVNNYPVAVFRRAAKYEEVLP